MQRRSLIAGLAALPLLPAMPRPAAAQGSFRFDSIDGGQYDMAAWRGRPVLVVNTASLCGYTPQYDELQALHERYGPRGLIVLAVPSDDFRQELARDEDVAEFCEVNFGLTLPMTTITPVRGSGAHPFYRGCATPRVRAGVELQQGAPDGQGRMVHELRVEHAADEPPHPARDRGAAGGVTRPLFLGSEIYRGSSYGAWHPPARAAGLDRDGPGTARWGWLGPDQYRTSPRAKKTPCADRIWHTPDYVRGAEAAPRPCRGERADPRPPRPWNGLQPRPYPECSAGPPRRRGLAAGGRVCWRMAVSSITPGAARITAFPTGRAGSATSTTRCWRCVSLRRAGARRIAYVDIDAHHADGVEHAFAGDPETLLISVHEERRWPFTGALEEDGGGNWLNLPVPRGFNDSEMEACARAPDPARVAGFAPDAIVLQCGADAVTGTAEPVDAVEHTHIGRCLRGLMALGCPRLLVLGGGGYKPLVGGAALDRGSGRC